MSGTINDAVVTTWPASIADILNGDDANQATFSPPITDLAKRTRFDHDELFTRGVRRMKSFASSAAAKAVNTGDVTTGDIARIAGQGIYFYNSDTAGDPELSPQQLLVTGTAGGIWRNIAIGYQSKNIANGIAGLDASAKVAAAQLRGQVIASYGHPSSSSATAGLTGTGARVDVTGTFLDITITGVQANDLIVALPSVVIGLAAANGYVNLFYTIKKTDNTLVYDFASGLVTSVSGLSGSISVPMAGIYRVDPNDLLTPTSTSLKIGVAQRATTGTTISFSGQSNFGILHIRNPALWAPFSTGC